MPEFASVSISAIALTALAAALLLGLRRGMVETLGVMALAGLALSFL